MSIEYKYPPKSFLQPTEILYLLGPPISLAPPADPQPFFYRRNLL